MKNTLSKSNQAFAILGPTASGKTQLALDLAQSFPCEIISLDSALVYQDMDIGTAKPTLAERQAVPHHLIDIITPLQSYSVADFLQDCLKKVEEIQQRGNFPLIVGGTMMYFHALTKGLNDLPEADENIRQQLQQDKEQLGLSFLYNQLEKIDPITAQRLKPNDSQRIERALEVFYLTNKPLSEHFQEQTQAQNALNIHTLTLIPENRALLHQQIAQRFENMLKNGFLDEVEYLKKCYPELHADLPSMRCVGYRQAWDYLEKSESYQDFKDKGIAATRQLAKRQLTWLRKLAADTILDPYQTNETQKIAIAQNALSHFFGIQ